MALLNLQKERLKKLDQIKEEGVIPFASKSSRKDLIKEAKKGLGKLVLIAGRIRSLRPHGKITFTDLEDETGKIQIFFAKDELLEKGFSFLGKLDIGDFIEVEGEVFKTQAGEITVRARRYRLLTKSLRPLPSLWYGLSDTEERYRQRYVDLIINPEVKKVFEIRHKVIKKIRQFMEERDFVEVETPTLQPIYGGATAKPFITRHNALGSDLYLRISDELYLKRLIIGGYEKIFEICKDFRNEGIDRQHNPEFTMMEFYWAYADYDDLINLTQELILKVIKEVCGLNQIEYEGKTLDFTPPFPRVAFNDLVREHSGIDLESVATEEELIKQIKEKRIEMDLKGLVGFGPICDALYKTVARPKIINPTFVIDYPYEMKPLAKRSEKDPKKSASFQLLCMGFEIVNAYNELNDPLEQRQRWEEQMTLAKRGLEEHQVIDEDYIRALEYGMPPTAGWGMGIDRFVALLANKHSLKEVILFPTLKPEVVEKKLPTKEDDKVGKPGITREQAYKLVTQLLKNQNLVKHSLAVEAIMRALARELKEKNRIDSRFRGNDNLLDAEFDEEEWGLVGLLHDADYERTGKDLDKHTNIIVDRLKKIGVSERIIQGILAHHELKKPIRENFLEKAIYAADELSGLITACALVRPDRKLSGLSVGSVLKKFKQKEFAAGAHRHQILTCESELGIPLEEFVGIALGAMQGISDELGL